MTGENFKFQIPELKTRHELNPFTNSLNSKKGLSVTYTQFEDLPVRQEAIKLAQATYDLTEDEAFRIPHSLRNQLERAALSVSNNIAEGFERGTTKELLAFLYIARGSSGEVRSMLCLIEHRKRFSNFKSQLANLKSLTISCSRQLRAWADNLQNSEIKSHRHLNDIVRNGLTSKKRTSSDLKSEI